MQPKILIVDDNPHNRLSIRTILKGLDVELQEASNGFDALSMTLDDDYAMILLDVQMPDMDGFEVCEQLRKDPRTAQTPVIFITAAYKDVADKIRGYVAGATDYLSKPIDDHILKAKVQVFLRLFRQQYELQQANEELRIAAIAFNSQEGIVITDPHARFLRVNKAFTKLTGYSDKEVIGRTPSILKSNRHDQEFYNELWRALHEDHYWQGELWNRRKNGEVYPEGLTITAVLDEFEQVTHYVGVFTDITERKSYEMQIRENEQRLLDIFDASPIAVSISTHKGRKVVFHNQCYAELIKNDRVMNRDPQSYYALTEDYQEVLAELARGNKIMNRQIELRLQDGSTAWALASYMPIQYHGETAVLGWFYDITERIDAQKALTRQLKLQRQTEDALRVTNEEQRAIFDAASSGIVLMTDRVILRCNRKLEEIFGYAHGELDGELLRLWYPDESAYIAQGSEVCKDILKGVFERSEQQLIRKNGSLFWARLFGRAVDTRDATRGVVLSVEDITAERNAAEILLKAKDIAEAAARSKTNFLANMSHQIRTSMNNIIGMTHLTMNSELSQKQTYYLTTIQQSGQELISLMNDILDFSLAESGNLPLEHKAFDLNIMLDNLAHQTHEQAAAKRLELIVDLPADVPVSLIGDFGRLTQVLLNFTSNALKFTERGEIRVILRKQDETPDTVTLKFIIQDSGIGISSENIHYLFDSFEHDVNIAQQIFGNTNIGLVICKKLVDLMGGQVGVESELGVGSTFWFSVTLKKGSDTPRRLELPPQWHGLPVLVVDDNEFARQVLVDMLTRFSFQVASADSGAGAIELINRAVEAGQPYKLALIDWQMPDLNGVETAIKINHLNVESAPKLLLLANYGREEIRKAAEKAGIADVLIKPVNSSILFESITQTLEVDNGEYSTPILESIPLEHRLTMLSGARILLVEDNQMNQLVARELLQKAGFLVDTADNGALAIKLIEEQVYDLVLMDMQMQMPVMDGVAATQAIREKPEYQSLPIVAMTADAFLQNRDKLIEAGVNDHLVKPVEPTALWEMVLKWINPH